MFPVGVWVVVVVLVVPVERFVPEAAAAEFVVLVQN